MQGYIWYARLHLICKIARKPTSLLYYWAKWGKVGKDNQTPVVCKTLSWARGQKSDTLDYFIHLKEYQPRYSILVQNLATGDKWSHYLKSKQSKLFIALRVSFWSAQHDEFKEPLQRYNCCTFEYHLILWQYLPPVEKILRFCSL